MTGSSAGELRRRLDAYGSFLSRARAAADTGRDDDALYWVFAAAWVPAAHHTGHWADPELEAVVDEVAGRIAAGLRSAATAPPGEERIVHLVSLVMDGGGHAEELLAWMRMLPGHGFSDQHLVSTELGPSPAVGRANLEAVRGFAGSVWLAPQRSAPTARVERLARRILELRPAVLLVNVNVNDTVADCAVKVVRRLSGMRVVAFVHGDHLFNVGLGNADVLLHHRTASVPYSVALRGLDPGRIRVIPLVAPRHTAGEGAARPPSTEGASSVSLTVGQAYKLAPDGEWDHGEAIATLLEQEPGHHHLWAGWGSAAQRARVLSAIRRRPRTVRRRFHVLGLRRDLRRLMAEADFVIDSAPVPGGLVQLEAMSAGAAFVGTRNRRWPLLSDGEILPADHELVAGSNDELVALARGLIADPGARPRAAERLRRHHEERFSDERAGRMLAEALAGRGAPPAYDPVTGALEYDLDYAVALSGAAPPAASLARQARWQLGYPALPPGYALARRWIASARLRASGRALA